METKKKGARRLKAGTRWDEGDLSGLKAFLARTPACVAAVLAHNGRRGPRLGDRLWAIPIGQLLEWGAGVSGTETGMRRNE